MGDNSAEVRRGEILKMLEAVAAVIERMETRFRRALDGAEDRRGVAIINREVQG